MTFMVASEKTSTPLIEVRAKTSMAPRIWFGLLLVVLCVLYLETRNGRHDKLNFFINTDSAAIGADVYIDHQKAGLISGAGGSGLGGGTFWTFLRNGPHLIEVKKANYATYSKEIDMHQEEYLGVDLQRANH